MERIPPPPHRSSLVVVSENWRNWYLDDGEREGAGDLLLATNVIDWPGVQLWERHEHDDPELLWNVVGTLRVETPSGVLLVPTGMNLWIPAGVPHEVIAPAGTALSCTWFSSARCPVAWTEPALVAVPPLLRSVLEHLSDFTLPVAERRRAEAFAFDLLAPSPTISLPVPLPADPGLRAVAERIMADPADARPLRDWSALAHLSVRSFTRAFARETGTSFVQWRLRVQMQRAMGLLSEGNTIETTGRMVGYQSPSAFIAAFTRVVGLTPGAYCARHA